MKKDYAESSFAVISNRAAFELGCPKEQLRLVALNVYRDVGGDLPSQVGVEGCGQRAVYIQSYGSGWVMNTESSRQKGQPDGHAR